MKTTKNILATLFLLLFPLMAWAGVVHEQEARQQALSFLKGRGQRVPDSASLQLAQHGNQVKGVAASTSPSYYIFNVEDNGGFVIVSGDDRTATILGYADEGRIDESTMPDGLRVLLESYAQEMGHLPATVSSVKAVKAQAPARHAIAPLIQTHWDQGTPYNNNSPLIDGKHTATGCVATAMAQVMYYHQWPQEACEIIPAYSTMTVNSNKESITISSDVLHELPATTFNWNDMTLSYSSSDTGVAADAVAELMQYCGWSLQMEYGLSANGGSSAFSVCVTEVLKTYFGYGKGVHTAFRNHYSYDEWISLLYSELTAQRPMVMGGSSAGGGHSFVCDGYDTDDYFHFNWGWGGSSDGYYRLSVLQPWEQGIGGSSTQDGFNFGQEAILGIQPSTSDTNEDGYCLSLEGFHFKGENSTASTMSFTRDAEDGSFKDIGISVTMFSYIFGTNNFDAIIVLVNSSNAYGIKGLNATGLEFNENNTWNTTMTIPSHVEDGTYYLDVWSKPYDGSSTTGWQSCYDTGQYMMKCVISGDNLTITVPIPANTLPTFNSIAVNGDKTVGSELEVIASFTGGTGDYLGDLFLYVNDKLMMGKTVDIKAGQTADVRFVYTVSEAGENTLRITRARSKNVTTLEKYLLGSTTVEITASDATNTQELNITPNVTNLTADGKLYGNAMRVTAMVTNTSEDNAYTGHVNCSLRMYNNIEDGEKDYYNAKVQTQHFTIAANSSTNLTFAYDGLDPTKFYRLRFSYLKGGDTEGGPITDPYAMGEGYALYAADGTVSIHPATETTISGYAAASVDLRSMSDLSDITASTNPNCVYFVQTGVALPTALEDKNIVRDGTASTLTLTDGNDFYTPFTFDATDVSYTRTFTLAANGSSGWNTLYLPFAVSRVSVADGTAKGKTVDWFHSSSDTGKNFWLRTFTGDAANTAYFDFADEIAANTPYIIAVPDDRFGAAWQMTGKEITFSGSDAVIGATTEYSISGNNYKLMGSTIGKTLTNVYALNDEGSSFKYAASTSVAPFRAWFCEASISSLALPALMIGSGQPTDGVMSLDRDDVHSTHDLIYDLGGRRVMNPHKPGLYIINGKKMIK